jgi:hypothetical protein
MLGIPQYCACISVSFHQHKILEVKMRDFGCKVLAGFAIGLISLVILALLPLPLEAQSFYGSVVGTVTDPSGGVIPGASASLTNLGTAEKRSAMTDSNGTYRFVNLVPGRYRLEVEASGFKRLTREPIAVVVEAAVRIDAALEIGNITETVSVTAETPQLQTESSTLSHAIEGRHVQEMPLNGRNPMNLIALVPGVVPQGSSAGSPMGNQGGTTSGAHTQNQGWANFQIGGGIAGHSASYLDGSPLNVVGMNNAIGLVATQDAVQEFSVSTNNVSAEFGRFGGGVVNMTTKSGTNEFHGSAYEYLRNRVLNANYFFSNAAGKDRPAWVQNQYGVTFGGPVIKDKTFFFFSWENFALRSGIAALNTVPTAAQRAGDFSGGAAIYDPLTTTIVGGKVTRTQFTNNIIPTNRIDPAANALANVLNFWPLPNTNLAGGNFASQPTSGGDSTQYNARIDQNIGNKQRIFGRFTWWHIDDIPFNPMLNFTGNSPSHNTTHSIVLGDTYTFTSNTVMDVRVSYMRQYYDDLPVNVGFDLSKMGTAAWASLNKLIPYTILPGPSITNIRSIVQVYDYRYWNNWAFSASLIKIQGRHSFKFGGEIRLQENTNINPGNAGAFTFNTQMTSANATTAGNAGGNAVASFLLGYPSSGSLSQGQWTDQYSWYEGFYFTDTFQASRKLTLNYGLRWELPGALAEKRDMATVLLPDVTDPLSQATGLNLKGQLVLVNSPQWPDRGVTTFSHALFAPRVGFAYRITDRWVLRSGYGLSYLPNNLAMGGAPASSPINSASTTMLATVNNAGQIPFTTLSNPFPAGGVPGTIQQEIVKPAGRSASYLRTLEGTTISSGVPDQPYPYVQQWNLDIERQLPRNVLIDIGYAGAKTTHIPLGMQLDQLAPQYYSMGSDLLTTVANPFYGLVPATNTLGRATTTKGQLLRPYPQFTGFTNSGQNIGVTSYHAMMVKVEKRFGTGGGILMGNYTWAKMTGTADTAQQFLEYGGVGTIQNYHDIRAEHSLLSYDVPHRAVVSYVLDVPLGEGRKFLGGTTGFAGKLVSGWGFNGIISLQSGYPLVLTASATTLSGSFGAGTPRPIVAEGCDRAISGTAQSRLNKWFNTGCFSQPGSYSFGNESRTDPQLRAHGVNNVDFAVFKTTGITERVKLQFRTEFFNLFNRVQFAVPGRTLGTSTFGVVSAQLNQPRLVQFALRLTF